MKARARVVRTRHGAVLRARTIGAGLRAGTPARRVKHEQASFWGGIPGECGAECLCGTTFDGFDSIADASAHIDRHIADETARAGLVAGLRELADYLEAHPDIPTPFSVVAQHSLLQTVESERVAEVHRVAELLGVDVNHGGRSLTADRYFAGGRYTVASVRYVIHATTDEGDALYTAESSYRGAVTP